MLKFILFVYITLICQVSIAAEKPKGFGAKIALQYYFDTRDYNTLNLTVGSYKLPVGFSVWGFSDLNSQQNQQSDRFDITRSFSEYRLSNDLIGKFLGVSGLGLQMEYNKFTPGKLDLLRFGLTYKQIIPIPELGFIGGKKGWIQLRGFPYETDGDGAQASIVYFFPLHSRVSLSGFADYNIREGQSNEWVDEAQLNITLYKNLAVVLEFRHNGFEANNPDLKGFGLATGIRIDL